MTPQFDKEQEKFYISVDCLILGFKNDKLYLLISKQKSEPLKGKDSLMGAFVRADESLLDTASRVVFEYTGVQDVFVEQLRAYGEISRYTAGRVVSLAYYALIDIQLFDEQLYKVHNTHWKQLDEVGELILNHNQILADAIETIRNKAATKPIGFSLLPEKFTLPQLQSLYEAIYQRELDKRNFRKKILEMDILEKQEGKDKSTSKRGAFFYKLNKEKYNQLLLKGYFFLL